MTRTLASQSQVQKTTQCFIDVADREAVPPLVLSNSRTPIPLDLSNPRTSPPLDLSNSTLLGVGKTPPPMRAVVNEGNFSFPETSLCTSPTFIQNGGGAIQDVTGNESELEDSDERKSDQGDSDEMALREIVNDRVATQAIPVASTREPPRRTSKRARVAK